MSMHINSQSRSDHYTVTGDERLCLSVTETATTLGVSKPTVWAAIARGELRVARAGRRVLVPVASIHDWLRSITDTCDGDLQP